MHVAALLLIFVGVLVFILVVAALVLAMDTKKKKIKMISMLLVSLILAGILSFCVVGFLATYEPLDRYVQLTGRLIYGIVGAACVGGLILVWRPSRSRRRHKVLV